MSHCSLLRSELGETQLTKAHVLHSVPTGGSRTSLYTKCRSDRKVILNELCDTSPRKGTSWPDVQM